MPTRAAPSADRIAGVPISVTEYNRLVTEWIREHWPTVTPCPLCGRMAGWELIPVGEIPLRLDVEGSTRGKALPVVPLLCRHCGYVVSLNAINIGVLPPDPAANEPNASATQSTEDAQ
jgi:hypothetical protein